MRLHSLRLCVFVTVAAAAAVATGSAQRVTSTAPPPVPTVMRPAQGQVVTGDLGIAVQVPAGVTARKYTIEAAYWDPARNAWVYPGTLGADFAGGTTASTRIAAAVRHRYNANATRWRIHVRVAEPAGGWGPWRDFTWLDAPAAESSGAAQATPAPAPTNIAAPAATTPPSTNVPAVQGQGQPPSTNVPAVQGQGQSSSAATPSPRMGPPATTTPAPAGTNPGPPDTSSRTRPAAPATTTWTQPAPPLTRTPSEPTPPTPAPVATPAPQPAPAPASTPPQPTSVPAGTSTPKSPTPVAPATAVPGTLRPVPIVPPSRTPSPPPTAPSTSARSSPPSMTARASRAPTAAQEETAAQGKPVKIVSSTTLQAWDGKPMPDNQKIYVDGPVDIDWTKKLLHWLFKYTTTAPAAVSGKVRWEMSRAPFPQYGSWKASPGFGYTGMANAGLSEPNTFVFPLDLDPYAPRPEGWVASVKAGGPQQNVAQMKPGGGSSQKPPLSSPASSLPGDLQIPQPPNVVGMAQAIPKTIPVSLSLYVRVIPLDKNGNDADWPSNFVELRFGPAPQPAPFNLDPKVWPQITFQSYRPVQGYTFDWQCWVKAATDIKAPAIFQLGVNPGTQDSSVILFHKGETRNSCDSDSGGLVGDIVSALGGFVELFKSFINAVSSAFDSIKNFAASTIASAIPGCSGNKLCEGAVMAGINAGLVALGMPPDIPDFDQLEAMGEDYLAETITQQVAAQTGIPGADEATKAAVKKMIEEGKKAAESGGNGSSLWIPDDGHQYKPLLIVVSASNPGTSNAAAMYLEIVETSTRYNPAKVPIPSLAPGQSFNVAIALQPTKDPKAWMKLLPTNNDYASFNLGPVVQKQQQAHDALAAWRTEYMSGWVTFRGSLTLPPFVAKQVFEKQCLANKAECLVQ